MDDNQAKKSETESASEKPAETATVTADSSATENPDEVTPVTPDSSATEKPVEEAALTPDSSAPEKPVEEAALTPDSSAPEKPVEVAELTPDPSATEKPVEVTPVTPDSSTTEKPVGETPVTPDSLAAKSAVKDRPKTQPASKEPKISSGTPSLEQMNEIILKKSRSMGMIMKWSLSTYFKFNPTYFLQLRGIMNIFHLILSLVVLILLSQSCHLYGQDLKISDGFYCRSSETFMFVIAISGFLMSVLYFFCCLLSKKTEALLYHTTLEVSYFIMYAILNIIAAISVMMTEDRAALEEVIKTSYNYNLSYASGVLGLINGLFYSISAIAFFLTHRFHNSGESEIEEEPI